MQAGTCTVGMHGTRFIYCTCYAFCTLVGVGVDLNFTLLSLVRLSSVGLGHISPFFKCRELDAHANLSGKIGRGHVSPVIEFSGLDAQARLQFPSLAGQKFA